MALDHSTNASKENSAPHFRLILVVVMLSSTVISERVPRMTDWSSITYNSLFIGAGCWLAHIGVYRLKALHYLWGWVCLVGSLLMLLMHVTLLMDRTRSLSPESLASTLIMATIGYLLIIDRRVRDFRRSLPPLVAKASTRHGV
jgi:hypothetical protein